MQSRIVKSDLRGLNNFVKGISEKSFVKVGIFGKKAKRKQGVLTNAEIGAIHEFGSFSRGIPDRSFLRLPLFQKSEQILSESSKGSLKMLVDGNLVGLLKRFGIVCENAIQEAFASAGFGAWAPNAPSTIRRKGSSAPLIDVGELRRSIASKVERRK
jgi:phage gpG-like protein